MCLRVKIRFGGLRLVVNVEISICRFAFLHFSIVFCFIFCFQLFKHNVVLSLSLSLDCVAVTQWIRIYPKERVIVAVVVVIVVVVNKNKSHD